jgi:hypothetical protein
VLCDVGLTDGRVQVRSEYPARASTSGYASTSGCASTARRFDGELGPATAQAVRIWCS